MARRRSTEEIEQLLEEFRISGKTQIEYCRQAGIALSTLGRYLRGHRVGKQRLIRVNVKSAAEPERSFVLVLGNGRRIESSWSFVDTDLARLIRVAERV